MVIKQVQTGENKQSGNQPGKKREKQAGYGE